MVTNPERRNASGQAGATLLLVLVLLLIISGVAGSFVWLMHRYQTQSGLQHRATAARSLAEAGVYRALALLEAGDTMSASVERDWRTAGFSEYRTVGPLEGRFSVSFADEDDGAIVITSAGEVAGVTRRVRARAYLMTRALLAAVYTPSFIRFHPRPAVTFILPYGRQATNRAWIHLAVGQDAVFPPSNASLNDPSLPFSVGPGPVDSSGEAPPAGLEPVRVMLPANAELTVHRKREHVDVQQLRVVGINLDGKVVRTPTLPPLPEVDRDYYRARAAANMGNAAVNEMAGKYVANPDLIRKTDSLYSSDEFDQLQTYLQAAAPRPRLQGIIYVGGAVLLREDQPLQVSEGSLIVEGALFVTENASLEITHSAVTRELPGVLVVGEGSMVVRQGARLRVHGLVYSAGGISVAPGASVDIVGALAVRNPRVGIVFAGTVVIRYDSAVLGTPGLRAPLEAPLVAWVAFWEELP